VSVYERERERERASERQRESGTVKRTKGVFAAPRQLYGKKKGDASPRVYQCNGLSLSFSRARALTPPPTHSRTQTHALSVALAVCV
jgi:hypothetical protein